MQPAYRAATVSFKYHWEFLAYAKAARIDVVLGRLRTIWGQMLAQGFTRFFEDIRPGDDEIQRLQFYGRPFANSLCHAWAGAGNTSRIVGPGVFDVKQKEDIS